MRQIKASEVKPGMTIRWDDGYGMQEITPSKVVPLDTQTPPATIFEGDWGVWRVAASDRMITVLSEPQPEEPTEFGARVIVDGGTALRTQDAEDEVDPDEGPWRVRTGRNTWDDVTWMELCARGPVTVVPD